MKKEVKVEEKTESIKVENNNYILGILGAVLGGLVASIPWIIMYVYLEILWSFMALIIGYGAFIGYKTF